MKRAFHRRRGWLALGMAGLLLLLTGWWRVTPHYEGRSLAYWFHEFQRTEQSPRQPHDRHVQRAIQAIGTNAVPYLLEQVFQEDFRSWDLRLWHRAVARLSWLEQAVPIGFREYLRERESGQFDPSDDARTWLWYLHPPVPLLFSTVTNQLASRRTQTRLKAIRMLGCLDATALPYLRPALADQDLNTRMAAFAGLARLGTNAAGAIPDLIRALDDPVFGREIPAQILQRIGTPARPALARLRQIWELETNFHALAAIVRIADETWARNEFRQSIHQREDQALRLAALRYLEENSFWGCADQSLPMADGAFLLPELLRAAEEAEAEVRFHALAAIGRLNLDPAPLKPWLEAKLQQPLPPKDNTSASWNEWHERLWASDLLLRCDPANAVALAFLSDRLGDFEAWQAVDILARLETPSPAVLTLLEQATRHRDQPVRELATEALSEFR